jgi:hypothetical protein
MMEPVSQSPLGCFRHKDNRQQTTDKQTNTHSNGPVSVTHRNNQPHNKQPHVSQSVTTFESTREIWDLRDTTLLPCCCCVPRCCCSLADDADADADDIDDACQITGLVRACVASSECLQKTAVGTETTPECLRCICTCVCGCVLLCPKLTHHSHAVL